MSERGGILRLGTRGSVLAVSQAEWVARALRAQSPGLAIELVRIRTSGDRIEGRSLAEIGGKGLFVKEIEEALLAGTIDLAVHSMKDLPAALAAGLGIAAVPRREDARDVLIAQGAGGLRGLPRGARLGTSSLRRRAFVRHARPDVEVLALRGNVDTRLAKWRAGEVDGLVLAAAGLRRLGANVPEARIVPAEEMVPAIGQGALAVEARLADRWWPLAAALGDRDSADEVSAERAFLRALGGDCTTPIAAHAAAAETALRLEAAIADPEGRRIVRDTRTAERSQAEALGASLAEELLARGGREILRALQR
jgi:hydroxymethylbilane synthase